MWWALDNPQKRPLLLERPRPAGGLIPMPRTRLHIERLVRLHGDAERPCAGGPGGARQFRSVAMVSHDVVAMITRGGLPVL